MSRYGNYQSELQMIKNHPASKKAKFDEIERMIKRDREVWLRGYTKMDFWKALAMVMPIVLLLAYAIYLTNK